MIVPERVQKFSRIDIKFLPNAITFSSESRLIPIRIDISLIIKILDQE